jgi:hypothetical protein
MKRLQYRFFEVGTDYHIEKRAYGRLLFDTNMCLERSDDRDPVGQYAPIN